ncbi:MAG: hypothetical protein ACYTEG_07940 [Planctomycetota bacterium]
MKSLGVFGLVSLGLVLLLGIYSCTILTEYDAVQKKIQQDFVDAAAKLQSMPKKQAPKTFSAAQFESWLQVREIVANVMTEGLKDTKAITNLLVRRVRNDALKSLAAELEQRKMVFTEYCDLQRRWHSFVARPEYGKLKEAWDKEVRVARPPEPFALPEPAKQVTPLEQELIKNNEARLLATLQADRLTKLLDLIEEGGELTEEPVEE